MVKNGGSYQHVKDEVQRGEVVAWILQRMKFFVGFEVLKGMSVERMESR